MKLWSGVLSPFSAKVRIALAEKKLDYETLVVPWSRKTLWGPKPPEFLAVSPRGQVPVLIDGDVTVFDSTVICEYLEDRYPKPPLLPDRPDARAGCRQLEDEADFAMGQEVTPLVQELFTKTDDASRDMARVANASEALRRRYDALEKQLTGREYLCGTFSVADIATFMVVGFASTFGVAPSDGHKSLRAWADRVRARPSLGREFEAMTRAAAAV
jgi:glutathione S-transferase